MPLLVVDGVAKAYYRGGRHRVEVLRDVSFDVEPGEVVAVVGDAMSGKTTLLRIVAGLEVPDAGSVRLEGAHRAASGELDPRIGFVTRKPPPREVRGLPMTDFVGMSIWDDIGVKKARHPATEVLHLFELRELERARWDELSDVERMLMRIAQAVVRRPPILLLDDPLHGLTISHGEAVVARIRSTALEHNMAVVMTVSDIPNAVRADAVWMLSAGTLVKASRERGRVVDFRAGRGGA